MRPAPVTVLASLLLPLLLGCRPSPVPVENRPLHGANAAAWRAGGHRNGWTEALARWGGGGAGAMSMAAPPAADPSLLPARLMAEAVEAETLTGARRNESLGEDLEAAMDEFSPAEQNRDGLSLLSAEQLFGTEEAGGLCEMPELEVDWSEGGADYVASLAVYTYTALLGDPTPMFVSISEACVAGVQSAGGDIPAAIGSGACAEDEARTFFAEGSACRTCVEETGGDYVACQDSASCPLEAPLAVWIDDAVGERSWYRGVYAETWACAPDWLAPLYLMADYGDDGVLPATWDHDRWAFLCSPFWDEETGAPQVSCTGGDTPGTRGVLAEGLFGFVSALDVEGAEVQGYRGREYYVDEVHFGGGATISWWWAYPGGLAALSAPREIADTNGDGLVGVGDEDWGYGSGGFGLNPHDTRPDGSSMARDWLAVAAMKVSTTENGVPIVVAERSRCAAGAWSGPDALGRYRCSRMDAPEGDWLNDGYLPFADLEKTQTGSYPLLNLASTGLPDEDVPGGFVVHLAGSSTLALPDWEDCTLPHHFEPDLIPLEDHPLDYGGPAHQDGQSWNFDGADRPDFRVVLGTSRLRGWCGGDETGGGRSALDR